MVTRTQGETMKTRAERLSWAIENHGPGDRSPRAFQRQSRGHVGRVRSSWYAVKGYLSGEREIHDAYLEGAVHVLGPVSLEWLKSGQGPRTTDSTSPEPVPNAPPPPTPPEEPAPAPDDDPWADIRRTVELAGPEPGADALADLDPKHPRNGLTERNWGILYAVVAGRTDGDVAEEVGLSASRVRGICAEYSELVRKAAGVEA